jgi:5,6,7,8-tetrahydromethanopterin hydro-lyase
VLGERDGQVGAAWATALATPTAGHTAFVAVVRPGLAVKPFTLFVSKATIEERLHAEMTWGPAQAGVATGVADVVAEGVVSTEEADRLVLIAAVWVDPAALDADAVFTNNREATVGALRAGRSGHPPAAEAIAARDDAWNPFFRAPG